MVARAIPGPNDTADAIRMRAYRARRQAGEVESRYIVPSGPVVQWTDDVRCEAEQVWADGYRRAMAGWLLGQRSPHTRRAYQQAWKAWLGWCEEHGENPVEPGVGVCAAWTVAMDQAGLAPATRRLRQYAVRSALVNLTCEGVRMGGDPFARIRPPVISWESTTVPLSTVEVCQLRDAARTMRGRFECAFRLCAELGLRAVEAGQVDAGCVSESQWGTVARIVRKGGRPALVPILPGIVAAAGRDCWPHVPDRDATRNSERIRGMIREVGRVAGVRVYPHQLRHWHVTAALEAGVPLHLVQDSAGHADPRTTQRYNDARHKVTDHTAFTIERLLAGAGPADAHGAHQPGTAGGPGENTGTTEATS